VTVHVDWETPEQRMERCDHEGTSEPLAEPPSITPARSAGRSGRYGSEPERRASSLSGRRLSRDARLVIGSRRSYDRALDLGGSPP